MAIWAKLNNVRKKRKEAKEYRQFMSTGKMPWKPGYETYKRNTIIEYIDNNTFKLDKLKCGYGFRIDERIVEYPWLFSRLPRGEGRLLDAGSALNFPYLLTREPIFSKDVFISTLSPESFYSDGKKISYIFEDLRSSSLRSNFFDFIVSISTVEHIGLDNTFLYTGDKTKKENNTKAYLAAVLELYRMLKTGGKLYISVPYGKYKNHGWFQVFDTGMVDELINVFNPSTVEEYYFGYDPSGWVISTREKSRNATCFDINVQKEYDEDFAAFSRSIVCLELEK